VIFWWMRRLCFILFYGLLFSCSFTEPTGGEAQYFNIDSLLSETQAALIASNPLVKKEVEINGQRESQTTNYDSLQWSEELKLLWDLDISAPRYRNAFDQTSEVPLAFERNEKDKNGLQSLTITSGNIKGEIIENTSIYSNHQRVEIAFSNKKISSIKVEGFQKMVLLDTTFYSSTIEIEY